MITPNSRLYPLRTLIASSALACAFGYLLATTMNEPVAREPHELQDRSERPSSASAASEVRNAFRRSSGYGSGPPGQGVSLPQVQQVRHGEKVQNVTSAPKDAQFAADSAKRTAEYLPELERLGLSREQAASVLSRLDDLHRGAITAGDSTLVLLQERERYDTDMKAMFGEKAYGEYLDFETSRPFRREVVDIQSFAAERGNRLSPAAEAQLPDLLRGINT